jgi:deoxyribose-phosphate aldolase
MFSFTLIDPVTEESVRRDLQDILQNSTLPGNNAFALRKIFSLLDFTTLDGTDNEGKIQTFCEKALAYASQGLPLPAAVCIYPPFISLAKRILTGTPVRVATTAAAFPSGQMPLKVKLAEVGYALEEGADEVDIVISRGTFLAREYNRVFDEIAAIKEMTGPTTLKVILETGELKSHENIARASEIAIRAGADFIKTSTGKISPAATEDAVLVMLRIIRAWYMQTGKKVGIKPAGGITEPEQALNYYRLVTEVNGPEWLEPELFRIGASRLADQLSSQII